tara:strand:- start:243 stop:605 length:363 start_codon:yes stop_codon:yes gene_type:complete
MEEIQEDLMDSCFKLFQDEDIMMACFNQEVYNPESHKLIHIASCNPIFYAHPFGRRAVLGIPAYSRRMLNFSMRNYEEQGPLMITSSLEGFRGYVVEEVEIGDGPGVPVKKRSVPATDGN